MLSAIGPSADLQIHPADPDPFPVFATVVSAAACRIKIHRHRAHPPAPPANPFLVALL